MLNILFISHDAVPYGAPKSMINIIDGLHDEIKFVVLLPYQGEIHKELECREIEHHITRYYWDVYSLSSITDFILFPLRLTRHYISIFKTLRLIKKLHRIHHFDLIHTNSGVVRVGFFASKFFNVPHIWHIREFQTKDYNLNILFGKKYLVKLFKSSTQTICVSKSVHNYFELDSSSVIYNGVMPKPVEKIIYEKDDYLIFAASLIPQKGIYNVLEAFIQFAKINSTTKLYICGTGDEENIRKIKSIINGAGIQNRIKLLGYRTDVLALLKKATACIVSSHHEAFGRITAEAMLMGCPVIGNASEGTLEIIKDHSYGWLYNDENELVNAIAFITDSNNKNAVATKIAKAKLRADSLFTQEQLTKNIMSVYQDVLKKNNKI